MGHGHFLAVGKLIDGYLKEITHDSNLSLSGFIDLAESIPYAARPIHDGLYKAIDEYLKVNLLYLNTYFVKSLQIFTLVNLIIIDTLLMMKCWFFYKSSGAPRLNKG